MFKAAFLIIKGFKEELLESKFDKILNFFGEIGKEEVFTNVLYFEILEGKAAIIDGESEFLFIRDFGKRMEDLKITKDFMKALNDDFEVSEVKVPRLLSVYKEKQGKS